jgi:solute carrier family 12 (potassium/chloride transporters), member 9
MFLINPIYGDVYQPHAGLGREQISNVWLREQSPDWAIRLRLPNLDLSLLLAYQQARNWHGRINLITVVADESERENAERYLHQLVDLGRMPRGTRTIVGTGRFSEYMTHDPDADLQLFGLQERVNLAFMTHIMTETKSSCIVVRDSGAESALV